MREHETELEMVRRHAELGAALVAKQQSLLARLRRKGLPSAEAEVLLATLRATQRQHEAHLTRIAREQSSAVC